MKADRHMVLVPGFVGFDALGTLRYYVGVTELFQDWAREHEDAALHYFDNFPTASVAMRAERLRVFLAKRMARRQIGDADHVTLVGHSTGGLDIRKLLELIADDEGKTPVDGAQPIKHCRMKRVIKRVVFLSVPHYGTNIASYVQCFEAAVKREIANLRDIVRLNQPSTSLLRRRLTGWIDPKHMQALQAVIDVLNETDEGFALPEAKRATERQARYELLLWLDHMAHELDAIGDLSVATSRPPKQGTPKSPAHYTAEERRNEIGAWPTGLQIRSYANYVSRSRISGRRPATIIAEAVRLLGSGPVRLGTWTANTVSRTLGLRWLTPAALQGLLALVELTPVGLYFAAAYLRPRLLSETAYVLCARSSGPFRAPPKDDDTFFPQDKVANVAARDAVDAIGANELTDADNDCIVNTLSMLWPNPQGNGIQHEVFLIEADHADIVGHYAAEPADKESARIYDAYNIFQSSLEFKEFERVWTEIFEFACPAQPQRAAKASKTTLPGRKGNGRKGNGRKR